MRVLTPEECEFIAGGRQVAQAYNAEPQPPAPIVVSGSPPPYTPPPFWPPPPAPPPYYNPPPPPPSSGGGYSPPPANDGTSVDFDVSQAGTIDEKEATAIENIRTATLNVQAMLGGIPDGVLVPIPNLNNDVYHIPSLSYDQLQASALNIDFKIMKDDGINNGGVGSTQGTAANPYFVLETDGPNGNGLTGWGASLASAEIYVLHELAHTTAAATIYYQQQFQSWSNANAGSNVANFNNSQQWKNTEAFAWSIARSTVQAAGGTWTYVPREGFLW